MLMLHAPAKVNLFLRVLAREDTGFHQLETLFVALDMGDTLTLAPAPRGIRLEIDGPPMGPPEENLVYRAAKGFLETAGLQGGVELRLKKRIPTQAGLGGGSSDAAATLQGMSELYPGHLGEVDLLEVARGLGADVPFFMSSSPFALAWGRGDRILPLPPLPAAPVLLALPPVGIPTAWAYALLARERASAPTPEPGGILKLDSFNSWEGVAALARNDFEEVVFRAHPTLEEIRKALEETSPRFALLSGSGAALFALYPGLDGARWARDCMREQFPEVRFVLSHTLGGGQDPSEGTGVEP